MDIKLCNFTSEYEILAGISSAFIILNFANRYIIKYLTPKLKEKTRQIIALIERAKNTSDYIRPALATLRASGDGRAAAFEALLKETERCQKALMLYRTHMSVRNEIKVIVTKMEALLWANFFYCFSILVIAGLEASGCFSHPLIPFDLVGNMTAAFLVLDLGWLIIWQGPWKVTEWYTGVLVIVLAIVIAVAYTFACHAPATMVMAYPGLFIGCIILVAIVLGSADGYLAMLSLPGVTAFPLPVLLLSLLVCFLPFVVAGCRVPYFFQRLLPRKEREVQAMDDLLRQIRDFAEPGGL
ncbi:hypothetical protein [Taibaiella koreensis]|uniref:hypothetical protein n=1 Tax=Taibaiella koreensis TaxID=1268548 RepID=UPI000E59D73F|nr:hypothetical protein [Taibaiella koreensis]